MRKIKLFLSLLMVMLVSVGNVWAETVTYSVTSTSAVSTSGTAPEGSSATYSQTYGTACQATSGNSFTLTLSGYEGYKITAISLSMHSNSSKGAGSLSVNAGSTTICSIDDSKFNTSSWYGNWSTSYVTVTPSMSEDDYEIQEEEDVVFSIAATANSLYCQSFTITYEEAGSTCETLAAPTNPSSTPAQTSVVLNWDAVEHASGYKVVFNGTDYDIASGTTKTIEGLAMETEYHWTVAAKGDGTTYCAAGTATAQQSVTTLDACTANKAVYTLASKTSVTSSGALEGSTATFLNDGTNNDDQMTADKTMTLTLSGYEGATIKGLTLSMHSNASKGAGTFSLMIGSTEVATISTATAFNEWFDNDSYGTTYRNVHIPFANDVVVGTGENIQVVIAATTNSLYCQSFSFCYEEPAPVAVKKPAFNLATGTYLGTQSVEITCETEDADIYYTIDGNDPTSGSTPYTSAIAISETKTLKAIAIKGSDESPIATAIYTIINTEHAGTLEDPYSVADAIAVIDGIGTKADAHVSGKISQVDSYDSNHKSITYWISADGTTSGQQLQVYSGKGLNGADFSSVDDVVAKATVVVKGTLKKYNSTYEFDYNNQLVSYTEPVDPTVTLKQSGSAVTELNVEATEVANQEIDIVCANFESQITSVIAKLYEESTCDTEITSGAWVTDITIDGAKLTFNIAANTGDARQVWMKVTASDGTNEAYAVLAISQAKYTVDYAELPFAFDGGRADIENKNGMTQNGLGTDYNNSPKLKFDGTGDVVIIKIKADQDPGTLTYDIKGNTFSEGTFKVQQSANGVDYSDVASYAELGTESESKTLAQTTRYVKFIYTEKVNGNVALGNIAISVYEAPVVTPTVVADPDEIENVAFAGVTDQTIDLTYENITDYETEVTVHPNADGTGILTPAWLTASVSDADDYATVTYSVAANDGAARTAYIKVYTTDGDKEATTIIPISQAEYVAPFDGLELTFPDEGSDGSNVSSYTTSWTATIGTQSWSMYGFNTNKWGWNPEVIKTGRKNNSGTAQPLTATIVTQVTDHAVGDIVVTVDAVTAAQITSHKLYVADNSEFTNAIEIEGDPATIAAGNITYTVPTANRANDLYYKLEYATAGTAGSNGTLTISKITYAYATAAPQKQSTGLAYADELKNHLVKVGAPYEAPTLTNPDNLTGITYASSADAVVEVNATTGALTIKAAGKAVITASRAEDDTYKAGSASYTIYVATEAGTAADPLSEASAKSLIDLGCTMEAHVHGVVQGEQDATKFTVTLAGGMQFYKLKDLGNVAFESAYIGNGDEVTAVGSLLKYNNSIYELAEGCYLTAYTEYTEPVVTLKQSGSTVTSLNLDATGVANQAIDVECTNFADAISSVTAELYEESTCENEITSGAWVTDITVNGAKDQVTFNVADNTGASRQVWMKVTASDGTDEASAVLAISQAKSAYATMPFAFDGGKNDVVNTNGMSHSGLGSDYGSSPKLKFDNTGDYLIIRINEDPGKLTYDIKNNSFSGGTFTVQESADGETYTEVASHTEIENTQNEEVDLKETTRYVKFIYTEKVTGNVGLGNITISKYEAPDYGSYQRDGLTQGNYATICLPNGGTMSNNAKLFDLDYYDGVNTLYLLEVNGNAMVAGRPYIFLPSETSIEVTYTDGANASAGSFNGLVGSYSQTTITANEGNYILYNSQYWYVDSEAYVGENRAYIHMDGVSTTPTPQVGQAPRRRVAMTVNGAQTATGMDELNASEAPVKVIIDGQLFIIRGEQMFNANGQLVK